MSKLFITGITGTLGQAILDLISIKTPHKTRRLKKNWFVYGIGSSESKIKELELLYRESKNEKPSRNLILFAGDICDQTILNQCISNSNAVIHVAAKKQIENVQRCPISAFNTNIFSTLLIAEICRHYQKRFVFMSTDKAVNPVGFYGWSKKIAEQIVLGDDKRLLSEDIDQFSGTVIRSGNILASSGSIFEIWKNTAKQGYITKFGKGHTRYVVKREVLAKLIIEASRSDWQSKIIIPQEMELWDIDGLADAVAKYLGLKAKVVEQGIIQKGIPDKLHEDLYTAEELDKGKVFLWEENKGLQPAPSKYLWQRCIPDQKVIEELWMSVDKQD